MHKIEQDFKKWAAKRGYDVTRKDNAWAHRQTAAAFDGYLAGLERFDLAAELDRVTDAGYAPCVIYDDNGNWAISDEGVSSVRRDGGDFACTMCGEGDWFRPSVQEAWECYLERLRKLGNVV